MVYLIGSNKHSDSLWWEYHVLTPKKIPHLVGVIAKKELTQKVRNVVVDMVHKTVTFESFDDFIGLYESVESNWDSETWHIFESQEVVE